MFDILFRSSSWSWGTFLLYYLVSTIVVELCSLASMYGEKSCSGRRCSIYYFVAFFILVILATARSSNVGTDTASYVEFYNSLSGSYDDFDWTNLFSFYQIEPGFYLFVSVVHSISTDYRFLFFAVYSILATAYIYFIKHFYSHEYGRSFLKLFIFFFVSNMSGMRAGLATAPLLISLVCLDRRCYGRSIVLSILAFSCHYTMIYNFAIILGILLLNKFPRLFSKRYFVLGVAGMIVLAIGGMSVLRGLFDDTKFSYYTSQLDDLSFTGSVIYVAFAYFLYKTLNKTCANTPMMTLYKICFLFLISYPIIYISGAYRIPNYYAMPRLVCWCYLINLGKKTKFNFFSSKLVTEGLVFFYLLFRFSQTAMDGGFIYTLS